MHDAVKGPTLDGQVDGVQIEDVRADLLSKGLILSTLHVLQIQLYSQLAKGCGSYEGRRSYIPATSFYRIGTTYGLLEKAHPRTYCSTCWERWDGMRALYCSSDRSVYSECCSTFVLVALNILSAKARGRRQANLA